jgi:glycosyltransferase involved in cell wall biosynthesis
MPRHDVAIYRPFAAGLYDRRLRRGGGGAELQTALLARGLAREGVRAAHIVLPVRDLLPPDSGLTILQRDRYAGGQGTLGRVTEVGRMWQALKEADAETYVIRGPASPEVGLAALFCRARRRKLVFCSSNPSDFTFDRLAHRRLRLRLYQLGVEMAEAVVVQTPEQLGLASRAFPRLPRLVEIPSFAEPVDSGPSEPQAFLWIGGLIPLKQPLRYAELARALPEARFWMIAVEDSETPADLAAELRDIARALPNLDLLEPRAHSETMKCMSQAVASVSTSREEGMPNIFLEAWARGVPALSLHVDPDGRIAERKLGVSAGGSWERFVAGARELWHSRPSRAALSRRTRAYIEDVHSFAGVTRRWTELLDELRSSG